MQVKETVFSIGKWLTTAWLFIANSIGSLILIGIILVFVFGLFSSTTTTPNISEKILEPGGLDKVAIVNLSGPIVESAGSGDPLALSPEIVSSRRVLPLLDHLAEDDSVKVVVLRINSPGGAVVPSDEIYRKVLELREKKPVVASMGDTAASGGYYIAAGANKIIANPATITGSIGVIAQFPEVSGLFNKLGVEMRTFKTGEFKDIGSTTREVTAAEDEIINNMIDEMYDLFVSAIVDGRQMDEAKVRDLADGRIYTGLQAKQNGLIDELGNYDYSIEYASSLAGIDNPTVVEYSDQSLIETLFAAAGQQMPFRSLDKLTASHSFGVYYLLSL